MRTKIGLLKERYAALITAMDDLSNAQEAIAKQRDQFAKELEELRRQITEEVEASVTPETLIQMDIEEVH